VRTIAAARANSQITFWTRVPGSFMGAISSFRRPLATSLVFPLNRGTVVTRYARWPPESTPEMDFDGNT
jgi:hypothetical protein